MQCPSGEAFIQVAPHSQRRRRSGKQVQLLENSNARPLRRGAGEMIMKSLNFLTHQEIFNGAVQHLFVQGQAALLPQGGGAYRGYCGGCPVGS